MSNKNTDTQLSSKTTAKKSTLQQQRPAREAINDTLQEDDNRNNDYEQQNVIYPKSSIWCR